MVGTLVQNFSYPETDRDLIEDVKGIASTGTKKTFSAAVLFALRHAVKDGSLTRWAEE